MMGSLQTWIRPLRAVDHRQAAGGSDVQGFDPAKSIHIFVLGKRWKKMDPDWKVKLFYMGLGCVFVDSSCCSWQVFDP